MPAIEKSRKRPNIHFWLLVLGLIFFAAPAWAHDPSKSYLSVTVETNQIAGQWDIPLRDLQTVVPLELNTDGLVTWEKLHARYPAIVAYAFARLKISVNGKPAELRIASGDPTVEDFADGSYLELPFTLAGASSSTPAELEISYQLFFDINSLHRGLLRLEANGKTQSAIFTPEHRTQLFELGETSGGRQFLVFLREGVWHIWTGYDHILFLLALLLPSVLQRESGQWPGTAVEIRNFKGTTWAAPSPQPSPPVGAREEKLRFRGATKLIPMAVQWRGVVALRPAFVNIFKIVTAFTVAHSLTLSLATLGVVKLPSRLTESAIAASVVLAAANNIWPMIRERGWLVAFGFGLVHGFGFATALGDLGLVRGALALTLVGFNAGVELGQLAIVGIFLPVAFGLRRSWFYQVPMLRVGSGVIILIAGTWFAERVFDFKVLPF